MLSLGIGSSSPARVLAETTRGRYGESIFKEDMDGKGAVLWDKANVRRGPWSPPTRMPSSAATWRTMVPAGNWIALPKRANSC